MILKITDLSSGAVSTYPNTDSNRHFVQFLGSGFRVELVEP